MLGDHAGVCLRPSPGWDDAARERVWEGRRPTGTEGERDAVRQRRDPTSEGRGARCRGFPGLPQRAVTAVERQGSARGGASRDVTAGVTLGLVSVPDGLAMGLLAGLNPVAGLYGYLVGTVTGALATSSVLMSVQATGAMAVLIADVPELHGAQDPARALATLGLLTGAVMLVAGVLRLGTLVRFVPNAVLTGFVNAVAVNIVLGQLADFTGYRSAQGSRITRALDTVSSPGSLHWPTVAIGAATIALIIVLERTRLRSLGLLVAVGVASAAAVVLVPFDAVQQLRDVTDIPGSLPRPVLPAFGLVPALLLPAVALAFVGLVQGAAISQTVANPDGTFPDVSGDFRGQGLANVACGFLRGMPVGGSMSATALLTTAGAHSRLANATAGIVIALAILLLSGPVALVAMPALAGLLMLIGYRTFKVAQVRMVWRTGPTQATVMTTTFVLTLLIPLQYAVLVGVAVSAILYVIGQSNRVRVVQLTFTGADPYPTESEPPPTVDVGTTTVLAVYGSLFFASAPVFEEQLPEVGPVAAGGAVVLVLRGHDDLGSTFLQALSRYQDKLEAAECHLVLAGVEDRALEQLRDTGMLARLGTANVFVATPTLGEAMHQATERADRLRDDTD
jgi:sulfate permease, SulP family